ncbi:uncharacterized protein [Oscarella lobularis]|uniref:uncharacterized protein n=1 Tax=Oscarella lobularis TaxID=121494 RepID=UPI00331407C5
MLFTTCFLLLINHLRLAEGQSADSANFFATSDWDLFNDYVTTYDRHYRTQAEQLHRFHAFRASLARIESLNAEDPNQPYGLTIFSDLTESEFRDQYLGYSPAPSPSAHETEADLTTYRVEHLPRRFDWRNVKNTVTPVKDQGQCGSCWAFSTTENIESVWAIYGPKQSLTKLSVQQIVDCESHSNGCQGDTTTAAYDYVLKAGGLESEEDYRYTAKDQRCRFRQSNVVARIDGFERVGRNETEMMLYLYNRAPLSVCVDAISWQHYRGGVMMKRCGTELGHCVLVTGYDMKGSVPYWIVRNSWGTKWGENGYIHLEMFRDECGLATEARSAYILK